MELNTKTNKKAIFLAGFLALSFLLSSLGAGRTNAETDELIDDYALYKKYQSYLNYQNKLNYQNYLKYAKYRKYKFKKEAERVKYETAYNNYQLYQTDPAVNAQYKKLKKQYLRYRNYLTYYVPHEQYAPYKNLKKYNKKKYNAGANYGGQEYLDGYNRYIAANGANSSGLGEANLGGGALGPEISIGLVQYSRSNLQDSAFEISAFNAATGSPLDYVIKDTAGTILATITPGSTETKVKHISGGQSFTVYNSVATPLTVPNDVQFEAVNTADAENIVFDFNRPSSNYDQYRGKIKLHYYDKENASDEIWAINTIPLEQYVWGMGEMTGTGPANHSNVMTTVFRTYGYWKIKFSTKYAAEGFKVNATPGNQLYYGYQWETAYAGIKTAATATQGKLVMYDKKTGTNEIALTPYSSWTDGKTRSFQERWGSSSYPWCKSVKDTYGKHSSMKAEDLLADGNHMVGLSAHGSLALAGSKHNWDWERILRYYYTGINLLKAY